MNRPAFPFLAGWHKAHDRAHWLESRRVGSSDIACILGVKDGPWKVWERHHRNYKEPASADTDRGHRWESTVLIAYGESSPNILEVRGTPSEFGLYIGPEPWATSTPDGFALDDELGWGLVEAKTDRMADWKWGEPGVIERWDDDAAERVRPDYALQVYHQMWCTDAPWCDLAVLGPFYDLKVYRIMRDPELEARLVETVRDWVQRHLVEGIDPRLDGSPAAGRELARRFSMAPGVGMRPASAAEAVWVRELAAARAMERMAKAQAALMSQHLIASIGHGTGLELGPGTAKLTRKKGRKTLDVKRLLENHPDLEPLLEFYTKTGAPSVHIRTHKLETPND